MDLLKYVNLKFVIYVLLFIFGAYLMLNAVDLGLGRLSDLLSANGGSMATDKYILSYELYVKSYLYLGSVFSIISALGIIKELSK